MKKKRKSWKKLFKSGSEDVKSESFGEQEADVGNQNTKSDAEIQADIKLADECFMRNDFEKAEELYKNVLKAFEGKDDKSNNEVNGDINVKISSILQGQGDLTTALEHLFCAKEIYKKCIDMDENDEVNVNIQAEKLIEIETGIANIYVDQGEIDNAENRYKDAVNICRELTNSKERLASVLMNYGNFLSICKRDHIGSVDTLKEVLKLQLRTTGAMNSSSASTLLCMGKVYMRRSRASNSKEATKDAERAEACFLRALQLFRLSMVRNSNEKVIDTLYNLNEARERQTKKGGILRSVRFEESTFANSGNHNTNNLPSSGSEDSSTYLSEDMDKFQSYSDLSEDKRLCYADLSFLQMFNCGTMEMRDDTV